MIEAGLIRVRVEETVLCRRVVGVIDRELIADEVGETVLYRVGETVLVERVVVLCGELTGVDVLRGRVALVEVGVEIGGEVVVSVDQTHHLKL